MIRTGNLGIILLYLLWSTTQTRAQLNGPEQIFLDSATINPEFGFQTDNGYILGGVKGSCHTAMIWRLDEDFNIVDQRALRHQYYELSEVLDMKWNDTTLEVLTRQIQFEDVVGDDGVKWYALNAEFEILDSLYVPGIEGFDGVFSDSYWILRTWKDSLISMDKITGLTIQAIPFPVTENRMHVSGSNLFVWDAKSLYRIDSTFQVDTLTFRSPILDIAVDSQHIYVLHGDQIRKMDWTERIKFQDSILSPQGAEALLFHPSDSALTVFTDVNEVYFYDRGLEETAQTRLFFDSIYVEDLHYVPLEDGSILRLGSTYLRKEVSQSLVYGQEFGMIHRFNRDYSEGDIERSDISLDALILMDPYYGSSEKTILLDTVYIVTKDHESRFHWQIVSTGQNPVRSGVIASNIFYSFNCFRGAHLNFIPDTILANSDSLSGGFEVYEIGEFPDGWEAQRYIYTAFPNGHYDADFSDNFREFTLRYIISSTEYALDPGLVHIWPNPTTDVIHLEIPPDLNFKNVVVLDLRGRIIYSQDLNIRNNRIRLPAEMLSGIYFLRLQTSDYHLVKKFSVVK